MLWKKNEKALVRFQDNLPDRDAKRPAFKFNLSKGGKEIFMVGSVSLSGTGALTVIAETEELKEAKNGTITDLFCSVWDNEIVPNNSSEKSTKVLKEIHPALFDKECPTNAASQKRYISMFDASELLRKSLNQCVKLLRCSENFDSIEFSKWAETYYQTSVLLFGQAGLTPYKLKLLLIPQILKRGLIDVPWNHMCEGHEKSNHHAHKNFQTKTLRGGGIIHHQDPFFLENVFSFCQFVQLSDSNKEKKAVIEEAC